jgi:hypothetical protein
MSQESRNKRTHVFMHSAKHSYIRTVEISDRQTNSNFAQTNANQIRIRLVG